MPRIHSRCARGGGAGRLAGNSTCVVNAASGYVVSAPAPLRATVTRMMRAFTIALVATACGGKDAAAPAAPVSPSDSPGGEAVADPHAGMTPEMTRFHDVLRPLWHAEKGTQRKDDTCTALQTLSAEAQAVATAPPPRAANADTWTAGTNELVTSLGGLEAACSAPDEATFETAFSKVHDAFHALMTAAGTHHGHDAGHGHADGEGPHGHGDGHHDHGGHAH